MKVRNVHAQPCLLVTPWHSELNEKNERRWEKTRFKGGSPNCNVLYCVKYDVAIHTGYMAYVRLALSSCPRDTNNALVVHAWWSGSCMLAELEHSVRIWGKRDFEELDETAEYKQRDGAISNHTWSRCRCQLPVTGKKPGIAFRAQFHLGRFSSFHARNFMCAAACVRALFCVQLHNYNTYVSVATDHVCVWSAQRLYQYLQT